MTSMAGLRQPTVGRVDVLYGPGGVRSHRTALLVGHPHRALPDHQAEPGAAFWKVRRSLGASSLLWCQPLIAENS